MGGRIEIDLLENIIIIIMIFYFSIGYQWYIPKGI